MSRKTVVAAALLCAATVGSAVALIDPEPASAQQPKADAFTLTVPGFPEAALLKIRNASSDPGCGGENVSPPVQWSHPPAETKSFAVTITDPDGQKGFGSVHWVAYGIPQAIGALPEGAGTSSSKDFVTGANSNGKAVYRGPCPPVGDQPHHYVISVYALDLAPGALEPGLDRDKFLAAIKGHSLNETSIVLRYNR